MVLQILFILPMMVGVERPLTDLHGTDLLKVLKRRNHCLYLQRYVQNRQRPFASGFFTDILFREKEVRFIAINNGIDSDRQETSEFAPFLNIMNEWFVRDTSKKIKAVLKSRGSSGNAHTSNIPPYGYLKDPENPDHWIIDEEAAEVVRRIYRMTIEGKGPYQIARELSEEKIERPSYYLGKRDLEIMQATMTKKIRICGEEIRLLL